MRVREHWAEREEEKEGGVTIVLGGESDFLKRS